MVDKVILNAEERTITGKKVKHLRKEGKVPAVIYGHNTQPTAIAAHSVEATKAWRAAGKHRPIELSIGTKKQLAMVKSADIDPVKHQLRHLSLQAIKQTEKVDTEIPIKIRDAGETPAERAGLIVLQALETAEIRALPAKLPEFLEIPGEKLTEAGASVTIADIMPVDGVEIKSEPEVVVASVYEPSAIAAQNDAAGGTEEEPETEEEAVESVEGEAGEETEASTEESGDKTKKEE